MAKHLLISMLLSLSFLTVKANEIPLINPIHYTYSVEDGLNSNFICDLFNDSRGLLWIGTQNGLNVFDGKQFTSIDFKQVNESFVIKIIEDRYGTIWFATLNGEIFHISNNTAIPHPQNPKLRELDFNLAPTNLKIDEAGNLFINNGRFLLRVESDSLIAKKITTDDDGSMIAVNLITIEDNLIGFPFNKRYKDSMEVLIQFYDDSLYIAQNFGKFQFVKPYTANTKKSFAFNLLNTLFTYIGGSFKEYSLKAHPSNSIYFENDTSLWVGTQGDGVIHILNDQIVQKLLPGDRIHAIIKDFEGGFWIGTERGLFYYPNLISEPHNFRSTNETILFLHQYKSELVAINDHFQMISKDRLQSIPFLESAKVADNRIRYRHDNDQERFSHISSSRSDYLNNLYTIDWEKFDYNQIITSYPFIYVHEEDTFGFSYGRMLYQVNGKVLKIPNESKNVNRPHDIIPRGNHRYWVSHSKGILSLEVFPEKEKVEINHSIDVDDRIRWLFRLGESFFCTSIDDKIYTIDTVNYELTQISYLNREDIRTVYQISDKQALLGTSNGLVLLEELPNFGNSKFKMTNLSKQLGLSPIQIDDIEIVSDSIYTLAASKVVKYPLEIINYKAESIGKMSILSVEIDGESIDKNEELSFFTTQALSFSISSVSFKDRNEYQSLFRLLPINNDFQILHSNKLDFYQLPPDSYVLQIQDRFGKRLEFSFTVEAHFYQKWWFFLLIGLTLTTFIFLPVYLRGKYKTAEAKLHAEKDQWRLRTLTSQLKPHFIFNALSSIQAFILKNDARTSSEFLFKFSMHIRNALEQSRTETFELSKALEAAKTYLELEQMRLNDEFDFAIEVENGIKTEEILVPVMLLQPYVENAVIHGISSIDYRGTINISIKKNKDDTLQIFIKDNGKGMGASKSNGHGLGTTVNHERLQLMNKGKKGKYEVSIQNNPKEKGVEVKIQIHFMHEAD